MRPRHTLLALVLLFASCTHLAPLSTQQALDRLNVATTRVYDADGNLIASLHGEIDREIVPIDRIPIAVRDAVVAIEDERFYSHQGLDVRSIVRAAKENASNGARGSVQGGSTITQQLAKNLYFPKPSRTVSRKIAEARVTVQLERTYSKERILEMYLNTIYLGRGVYGIEAAARSYFGKTAAELTLADAAFLAGLIHEPGRYEWSPTDAQQRIDERRAAGEARRAVVLDRMVALGFISRDQANEASASPLKLKAVGEQHWTHPYFVDLVLRQLGVLRARTTDSLDPRYNFLGRTFAERTSRAYRGGLRIYTTLDPRAQDAAERAISSELPASLDRLSAALAAIEPSTGYVRALVGGRNYYPDCRRYKPSNAPTVCTLAKVNLALGEEGGGSGRQPGSSFKPFVLTAALERGIALSSTYDSSTFTHTYQGGVWNVHNYEGEGGGAMNLVDGTAHSVNAVFARLEIEGVGDGDALVGAQRVASIARRMGVSFPTPDDLRYRCGIEYARRDDCLPADLTPAIALGAKEVSPYEMASAYATFANDGVRVEPTAIARVEDLDGRVLFRANPERKRVIPAGVARAATAVLQEVIKRGTATAAAIDRPAAAKTGTSESWRDAWLDGFVPQLAAVVWVGNPIGLESMTPSNGYPYRIVGGTIPAHIWHAFMSKALADVRVRDFAAPPSVFFEGVTPTSTQPTPPAVPTVAVVPDVVDMSMSRASATLQSEGFSVAAIGQCDPAGEGSTGDVYRQSPSGGTASSSGSQVTIWWEPNGC